MQTCHVTLLLVAIMAACALAVEKREHKPMFGFMCKFPQAMRGNWTQTNNAAVKLRINKQHIHMMGKKFRCIDKHRGVVLAKEEKRGTGLTCIGYTAYTDSATMELQLKSYFPEPKEVRIDWRDQCNAVPDESISTIIFARV